MKGRTILYICMFSMLVMAAFSSVSALCGVEINDPTFNNLFEVLKLTAMVVLGYILGSNKQDHNN